MIFDQAFVNFCEKTPGQRHWSFFQYLSENTWSAASSRLFPNEKEPNRLLENENDKGEQMVLRGFLDRPEKVVCNVKVRRAETLNIHLVILEQDGYGMIWEDIE